MPAAGLHLPDVALVLRAGLSNLDLLDARCFTSAPGESIIIVAIIILARIHSFGVGSVHDVNWHDCL